MEEPKLVQVSILLEDRLRPVPEGIGVETFYENLRVVFETDGVENYSTGDHVIILGTEENIQKWLKPHSPICVGVGPLMLQEFRLKEVI